MTYLTVDEAQEYFDTRLHSEVWEEASLEDKLKALITSSRLVDTLNFSGEKTVSDQPMQFPRSGSTLIPDAIKIAVCEMSLALLDDIDMEHEIEALDSTGFNYATLRTSYNPAVSPEHIMAGIPSAVAWRYLKPYLADPNELRLVRTN